MKENKKNTYICIKYWKIYILLRCTPENFQLPTIFPSQAPENGFSPPLRSGENLHSSNVRQFSNYCIPNDYYLYFSPFIQSNVYFLTVQYLHPKMTETIEIKIPESYYIVGNQLYSSIFVLRCLQYQSKMFVFDENYSLEILDNNITIFQLKSNEYISIEKDEYKISGV